MKILHCADIHLGKRPIGSSDFSEIRYEDYFKGFSSVIDTALNEKVEVLVIAGDLFDKKEITPDILRKTEILFERLINSGIRTLIIEGNHDNIAKSNDIDSWLHYLEEKKLAKRLTYKREDDNYIFTPEVIKEIHFYGIGYPGFNVNFVLEKLSEKLDSSQKNVVLVHTDIGSSQSEYIPGIASSTSIKLLDGKAIYVGGGHTHSYRTYRDIPFFYIPGSTEFWDIKRERKDEKGVIIFDTDTREHKFIEIKSRKRIKKEINLKYLDSINGENLNSSQREEIIHREFRDIIKEFKMTGEELVVIKLNIENDIYIDTKGLEKILEEEGALKGYIIPNFLKRKNLDSNGENSDNMGIQDIELDIISEWEFFPAQDVIKYLQNFKNHQENKEKDLFMESFDKMLEEMI